MPRHHIINGKEIPFTEEEEIARDLEEARALEDQKTYNKDHRYKDDRRSEYPDIGDQLDALWKELNYRRLNGDNLVQDADDMLGQILAVKAKYPKGE